MATYNKGQLIKKENGTIIKSILDILLNKGLSLHVFHGNLSKNDIKIKFRDTSLPGTRVRQPSHIHWATDLMIKKQHEPKLVDSFLNDMLKVWDSTKPLKDRKHQTIINALTYSRNKAIWKKYRKLDTKGFFSMKFITHLMELLMIQEKTNRKDAYKFKEVIENLIKYKDIYKILASASMGKRKK